MKTRCPYRRHCMNVSDACNPPRLSDVGTRMHNELNVVYNWLVEHTGVKRLDAISSTLYRSLWLLKLGCLFSSTVCQ